jgi:arabinose-5-phosphate isomerase
VAVEDGRVVGIITDGDVRRAMETAQDQFFKRSVGDIMTTNPKSVGPDTKITTIEEILQSNKIHAVLVVDNRGQLLGVVDSFRTRI